MSHLQSSLDISICEAYAFSGMLLVTFLFEVYQLFYSCHIVYVFNVFNFLFQHFYSYDAWLSCWWVGGWQQLWAVSSHTLIYSHIETKVISLFNLQRDRTIAPLVVPTDNDSNGSDQNRWPWMTLNSVMAVTLRYFTDWVNQCSST